MFFLRFAINVGENHLLSHRWFSVDFPWFPQVQCSFDEKLQLCRNQGIHTVGCASPQIGWQLRVAAGISHWFSTWPSGKFMYPLVMTNSLLLKTTIEIVYFPINSMVIFNSYVKLPEGKFPVRPWKEPNFKCQWKRMETNLPSPIWQDLC